MLKCIRVALLLCAIAVFAPKGFAADQNLEQGILVEDPWARASATKLARAGAAYFTLTNLGDASDILVSAASDIAETVEIHEHTLRDGVMRMGPAGDIALPAGGSVILKPGGLHVMLIGLKYPLKKGNSFDLTLEFANADKITVSVSIGGVADKGPAGHKDHSNHGNRGNHGNHGKDHSHSNHSHN